MLVNSKDLKKYQDKLNNEGFFIVNKAFKNEEIELMLGRLKKIISGDIRIEGRRFQEDTKSGLYEDISKIKLGYKGPNVFYRKISDLEYDEIFLEKLKSGWIREICSKFVGSETSIMRVTMMDKPPSTGTLLPWHQDVSKKWPTSVQPKLAIWFSLDKTTEYTGSLEIIPESHKSGIIGDGHMITEENLKIFFENQKTIINTNPGDVVFFDTRILHRSGRNKTNNHRRAINAILFPGRVLHLKTNNFYPVLFGEEEITPESVKNLKKIPDLNLIDY